MKCKIKRLIPALVACSMSTLLGTAAHAEVSIAILGGIVNYTTQVRGDALYNFNGPGSAGYFQYPADVTNTDPAAGIMLRYLYDFRPRFRLGAETGYIYFPAHHTRLRADTIDVNNRPIPVENFTTHSNGVITLNAVLSVNLQPNLFLSIFAGPAWLNTRYVSDDFSDQFRRSTNNHFQSTADLGVEANWQCNEVSTLGMRFDYILNTAKKTISTEGSTTPVDGIPLQKADKARSGAVIFTLTYRYLVSTI